MTYNPYHFRFLTEDGLKLPALLYTPEHPTDRVALYLHGNGSSSIFYNPEFMNSMALTLNARGIAFFPFNNRGAHYIKSFRVLEEHEEKRVNLGTAFELIKECVLDINAAIKTLKDKGFKTFYLIGISTGANKIVVYDQLQNVNDVSKYVLLSGGDDTGLYYEQMGREQFFNCLAEARIQLDAGNGRELVPDTYVDNIISWQSIYDTINPDGDYNIFPFNEYMNKLRLSKKPLFGEFKALKKPALVVYGEMDEYCFGNVPKCVSILKEETQNKDNFKYVIIDQADHGFHNKEQELANIIANWL